MMGEGSKEGGGSRGPTGMHCRSWKEKNLQALKELERMSSKMEGSGCSEKL